MNEDLEAIDGLCAKIIAQRDRIEALEAALREINSWVAVIQNLAGAALPPAPRSGEASNKDAGQ